MLPVAVAEMQGVLASARSQGNAKKAVAPRRGKLMSAEQMARAHYDSQMAFDDELRNTDPRFASMGGVDEDYVAALNRAISGAASNDELRNTVGPIVTKFRQSQNTKVVDDTPEWRDLARVLAGAEYESLARTFERDEGDFSGIPTLPALTRTDQPLPIDPVAARALGPDSLKPLSEIVDRFAKERKATPSTDREYQVAVKMLEESMGEARPVYKIARQDIHAFKRALSEVPANYTKRFPDRTMLEATRDNKARKTPYPTLNSITINDKWLARIHAILAWCARNDIIPDNPATGIKVESVRENSQPPRVPFSPDDLTRLFGDKFLAGNKELGERQWAMLISLFSGMRASELAQLKLDSVRTERGILVFTIEEETKTAGSLRIVPVHSKLIELGLDKRIKALRRVGETHLFPEWYAKGMEAKKEARAKGGATLNHYFPRYIPKRFNDTYMPSVGINDSRKAWHSFRHTFKTGLSRAGVVKSMRDDLTGHADDSAGAVYVHEGSVEAMKEAVEKLTFDGFDLKVI
jgi:integrase